MSIREFNGHYSPVEDRVHMSLTGVDDCEYRLIFTRRILLAAAAILEQTTHAQLSEMAGKASTPEPTQLAEFRKEAIQQVTMFTDQLRGGSRFPMGQDPILIVGLRIDRDGPVDNILFELANGQTLNMRIPPETSYQFCLLLSVAASLAARTTGAV